MRILFLICGLYAVSARSAFAIKPASPKEISDIQDQIFIANRMDAKIVKANTDLYDAKQAKADGGKIMELEKALAREKDKQSAARTLAIHMTILAYGLEPASLSGTSVLSSTKGHTIAWLPVAREQEVRQIQNAAGKLEQLPKPKTDISGKVYPDGVAYIYPHAFAKGVGFLASTLLHERIHFEQITTQDKGNLMSRAESEAEAYQAEKDQELNFFDPNNKADKTEMDATDLALFTETAAAEQEKKERATLSGRLRDLLRPFSPPDMFESKVHTNAELADISGLVAQARAQADIARRDREERESHARAAAEKAARRDDDERLRNTLADLTQRSCANPGSVMQAELDALPRPYRDDFSYVDPVALKLPAVFADNSGLVDCFSLYEYLCRGGSDAEEVRRLATPIVVARPDPTAVHETPPVPFSTAFPQLKEFATTACRAPEQVSIDRYLFQPYDFSYRGYDDNLAADLASGLGECPRRLFYKLIELIRAGDSRQTDRQWIRNTVAAYWRAPDNSSGHTPRPPREESREPGCSEQNGVLGCPK